LFLLEEFGIVVNHLGCANDFGELAFCLLVVDLFTGTDFSLVVKNDLVLALAEVGELESGTDEDLQALVHVDLAEEIVEVADHSKSNVVHDDLIDTGDVGQVDDVDDLDCHDSCELQKRKQEGEAWELKLVDVH